MYDIDPVSAIEVVYRLAPVRITANCSMHARLLTNVRKRPDKHLQFTGDIRWDEDGPEVRLKKYDTTYHDWKEFWHQLDPKDTMWLSELGCNAQPDCAEVLVERRLGNIERNRVTQSAPKRVPKSVTQSAPKRVPKSVPSFDPNHQYTQADKAQLIRWCKQWNIRGVSERWKVETLCKRLREPKKGGGNRVKKSPRRKKSPRKKRRKSSVRRRKKRTD